MSSSLPPPFLDLSKADLFNPCLDDDFYCYEILEAEKENIPPPFHLPPPAIPLTSPKKRKPDFSNPLLEPHKRVKTNLINILPRHKAPLNLVDDSQLITVQYDSYMFTTNTSNPYYRELVIVNTSIPIRSAFIYKLENTLCNTLEYYCPKNVDIVAKACGIDRNILYCLLQKIAKARDHKIKRCAIIFYTENVAIEFGIPEKSNIVCELPELPTDVLFQLRQPDERSMLA